MNLAVKFYSTEENKPVGIPDAWPSRVVELGEGTSLPDNSYTLMTSVEYNTYRETHLVTYLAWKEPLDEAKRVEQEKREGIRRRSEHGAKVVEDFRLFTLDIPNEDAITLLGVFSPIISMLQLGILQAAAFTLDSITDVPVLNNYYNGVDGPTVKDFFVSRILEGDPLTT